MQVFQSTELLLYLYADIAVINYNDNISEQHTTSRCHGYHYCFIFRKFIVNFSEQRFRILTGPHGFPQPLQMLRLHHKSGKFDIPSISIWLCITCEICDSHISDYEGYCLWGCYAVWSLSSLLTFWRNVLPPSSGSKFLPDYTT